MITQLIIVVIILLSILITIHKPVEATPAAAARGAMLGQHPP